MIKSAKIPRRQKISLITTFGIGFLLLASTLFHLFNQQIVNLFIVFYGVAVPLFLFSGNGVIDLNKNNVFFIWLGVGVIMAVLSLLGLNNDDFIIQRSDRFDESSIVNSLISKHSTSALKSLFISLCVYWIFNKILRQKGLYFINTAKKPKWYHEEAQRKITWSDVVMNLILYFVACLSGVFGW